MEKKLENLSVGILGAGIAGVAAAKRLEKENVKVSIFDWGFTPGGRTAHRQLWVSSSGKESFFKPEFDTKTSETWWRLRFDHGAQFLKIKSKIVEDLISPLVKKNMLGHWPADSKGTGWISKDGKFLAIGSKEAKQIGNGFFGIFNPSVKSFAVRGGMSAICKEISSGKVNQRRRVTDVRKITTNGTEKWMFLGDKGHHEMSAASLKNSNLDILGKFDAVIITEHMAWLPAFHPCHLPSLHNMFPQAVKWVKERLRYNEDIRRFEEIAPLFTAMIAFDEDPGFYLNTSETLSTVCVEDDQVIQFIARQLPSKQIDDMSESDAHCFVVVSTKEFAEKCIEDTPMSTKDTYRPQEEKYLRSKPVDIMINSFLKIIEKVRNGAPPKVNILYKRCQRWGAAYPLWSDKSNSSKNNGSVENSGTYWNIKGTRIYFAGDFTRKPDEERYIESAALAGTSAADVILNASKSLNRPFIAS